MGARRRARERALQALYQIDVAGLPPDPALDYAWTSGDRSGPPDADAVAFARELVQGVCDHRAEIDQLLGSHSHHWRVERMARVDRNILRLAVFELVHRPEIPKRVTLNEAIELAKAYGSEESSAFINGVLDTIAQTVPRE